MDHFIAFLKSFVEDKVPAIIAIAMTIATYWCFLFLNEAILNKLGLTFILIFSFCVYLCLIILVKNIYLYIRKRIDISKQKKIENEKLINKAKAKEQQEKEEFDKTLEILRSFVDKLNSQDTKYLKDLVQGGNKPIVVKDKFDPSGKLLSSELVHKILIKEPKSIGYDIEPALYEYKLREDIFYLCTILMERYNSLSHSQRK